MSENMKPLEAMIAASRRKDHDKLRDYYDSARLEAPAKQESAA